MEIWKDIPGYVGKYQASCLGAIRSIDRYIKTPARNNLGQWKSGESEGFKFIKGVILKPIKQNNGYLMVWICGKYRSIHRLVDMTFLEDKTNKYILVEHLNHNKEDNRIQNLLWSDYKKNNIRNVLDGKWNNQWTKK